MINDEKIYDVLKETQTPNKAAVEDILNKAKELDGLDQKDVAYLLQTKDPELKQAIFDTAYQVKSDIYGKRLVLFAPLYISNECTNNCLYCGFRSMNKELVRRTLNYEEIKEEVEILIKQGHKRILLVCGEDPKISNLEYITKSVESVYSVKIPEGEIRRLNINCAPLDVESFKVLKSTGIGTYQCFQETYHRETYKKMHPIGAKADYDWRLNVMDRAMEAGIEDVGIGALFGLYDHKFEVLAMMDHIKHLEDKFGVGPHTISFPRLEPALNSKIAEHPPYEVSDEDFELMVAVIRLAVPYTGMILSTRESAETRDKLFNYGISQISAGSRTYPGAYKDESIGMPSEEQFSLGDTRNLDEVIYSVIEHGFIPSFCTACYRSGRTGEHFMELAKPGDIKSFCTLNAFMSFQEYLEDFASDKTKEAGNNMINKMLNDLPSEIKNNYTEKVNQIRKGTRDLYV